jgi:nitrogen regulatory protein PII
MKHLKRLDIIVNSYDVPRVVALLEEAGAEGYSVFPRVQGHGHRGARSADELTGVFQNSCVMCACNPEVVEKLTPGLRQLLQQTGGVCLLSDTQWLMH